MPDPIPHLYWDTNVFVAYLNDEKAAYGSYIDHIGQYLDEAKQGKCVIYTSTLTIAEVPRRRMVKSSYGSFTDFLSDYEGIIIQIAADPSVMHVAAEIKDLRYHKSGGIREVGTPDAIHLASACLDQHVRGVSYSFPHLRQREGQGYAWQGRAATLLRGVVQQL